MAPKKTACHLVITRNNGPVLLEARKEVLDKVARLLQVPVMLAWLFALGTPLQSNGTRRQDLQTMLTIALCTAIAGADNWVEVVEFGKLHQACFECLVPMPSGITSHDTFARILYLLDGQELERVCQLNHLGFELTPRSWTVAIPPTRRCFSAGIPPG